MSNVSLPRWPIIDLVRGLAVIAMVAFHFTWDLGFFEIIPYDISFTSEGRLASHLIAGTFLCLVGISLCLAHRSAFVPHAFLKRFGLIAAAAAAVSLATFYAMPDEWIFFGILHCIALSSLLALPFLRAPLPIIFVAASAFVVAPLLVGHPVFEDPGLYWLGLNKVMPRTNDYVPVFPWAGIVLFGLLAARLVMITPRCEAMAMRPFRGRSARFLMALGRQALPIYLLHQPVMMLLLWAALSVLGPISPGASLDPAFIDDCTQSCAASGRAPDACARSCACLGDALSRLPAQGGDDPFSKALMICQKRGVL